MCVVATGQSAARAALCPVATTHIMKETIVDIYELFCRVVKDESMHIIYCC